MADELETAEMNESVLVDATVRNAMLAASNIPKGEPGECIKCGETYSRLVRNVCARCRDKLKLP